MCCRFPSLEHTQLSMVRKATGISSIAASEYSLVWNTRNFTTKILILQIDLKLNDDYTIVVVVVCIFRDLEKQRNIKLEYETM